MRLFLLTLILLVTGCSQRKDYNEPTVIDVNTQGGAKFKAKVHRITDIETSDSSLVGQVTKLIYYKGNIYLFDILHKRTVTCFSNEGDYKYSIPHGKGPGEVISPEDFALHNDKLLINDRGFIKEYDYNSGKYLGDKYLPNLFIKKITVLDSGNFLSFSFSPKQKDIIKATSKDELKNKLVLYKIVNPESQLEVSAFLKGDFDFSLVSPNKPVSEYNNKYLLLNPPASDIYEFDGKELKIKYHIDFGEYSFSNNELDRGIDYYISSIQEQNRYGFIDNINETEDFVLFSFIKDVGKPTFCLYSKKSKQSALFESILKSNNLPNLSPLFTYDNYIICILNPSELSKQELYVLNNNYNLSRSIDIMSNPLIVLLNINEPNAKAVL